MGNSCLKGSRSSNMVWAETDDENDHWVYYSDPNLQQKQTLLCDERIDNISHPSISVNQNNNNGKNTEVKIILSKKKLEELLGKVEDVRNTPVNQILDRLIESSDRFELSYDDGHHQPWKPNLKSIPEEN
ncbi:hypothetical protein L1987_58496 [Smallanthus sonchifolius]|uniref:Uncharacterized protein n=1 Tax=Smallanthus sonchifolius TaxID=185202 RepID=A0ACB9DFX6_9ASTR|nr:hypothetical protein L1987_58496 [Smallanthus sonchifolius]